MRKIPGSVKEVQCHRALEMHIKGRGFRAIAAELEISVSTAHQLVKEALAAQPVPDVAEFRKVENERLDQAYVEASKTAFDENADPELRLKAIDRVVRIMDRRARLLGLDAPVKVDATHTVQTQAEAELEALLAEADAANAARQKELESS